MSYVDISIDSHDVLSHIPQSEIIEYYGSDYLLDEIGIENIKEYFNLVDAE